jgi:multidrug efflux pump
MTLSDLSVRRPVFAAVAAIILVVVGLAAFTTLSVRELPSVDPAQVSIQTTYVGASAEVVEERITQVIERQVAGIQGIDRVNSVSRDGRSQINISFLPDRNLEQAANDVRDAVSRVIRGLPLGVDPPTVNKANSDAVPIMIVNLRSTTMNKLELTDYGNRYLVERLSTIPGVSQVGLGGGQNYAMRIWLDPDAMAARGITVEDISTALNAQNVELPAGSLESTAKDYTIRVARQYARPEDFRQLPIVTPTTTTGAGALLATNGAGGTTVGTTGGARAASGYITRLGDVARVEEGADERRRLFRGRGVDMVGFQIIRQSDANDLDIAKGTIKAVEEINKTLPKGTEMFIAVDFSVFTSEAIKEVWWTMGISLFLVAVVNIIFLGSWRSAIIPTIVAPICIVSTFIVLAVLGFSINLLTLLALVLAIGLVVDDAIVVVENIQRRIDEGEPPLVAAERGARQVFFAIIAVTAVLLTVFAPMMFMKSYSGKLFVELAVAVAAAVAFSAVLALSLSPMLASKLLRPVHGQGWLARKVDWSLDKLRNSYANSLNAILPNGMAGLVAGIVVLALAAAAGGLFIVLPKELVPSEDRGQIQLNATGPEGSGYDYMVKVVAQIEPVLQKLVDEKIVERYVVQAPGFGGGAGSFNSAGGNVIMVDWGHRPKMEVTDPASGKKVMKRATADLVASRLNRELSVITGARINASVRAALGGGPGGGGAGNSIQMIAKGAEYDELNTWMQPILTAAQGSSLFQRPRLDYEPNSPRLLINLDRDKAAALGVQPRAIGNVLSTMLGSSRVTTYVKAGQEYDVILQTELDERRTEADLARLYVRSSQGVLVPLSSLVTTELRGDTPDRRRVDRQRAITFNADLADGVTMEEGINFLKAEVAKQPPTAVITWGGSAKDFLEGQGGIGFAFGMALLLVFLVLAAQFESWIHPAVIISTVPLAALGGLFALLMAGSSLNLYSQIGLIILIGIAAKNGILIVEFANQLRDEGRTVQEAIIEACTVRLRPILMTSIAASMGALPLIFAHGPGAASRNTIGVVIFSGCLFATLLTLFIVPIFYNLLARFTKSPEWTARLIDDFEKNEQTSEMKLAAE